MTSIRNLIKIVEAEAAPAASTASFDIKDYLRRLKMVCIELQRQRNARSPDATPAKKLDTAELAKLVDLGMRKARTELPKSSRNTFIDLMRRIVATSGVSLPSSSHTAITTALDNTDATPPVAKPSGMTVTERPPEFIFPDRLSRFVKKWEEGDPQWRLLQCATRAVNQTVYVVGFAETSPQQYSLFHGVDGGQYKTKETSLANAQDTMATAVQRGYSIIPPQVLASKIGVAHVANQQYPIERLGRRATDRPYDQDQSPPPSGANLGRRSTDRSSNDPLRPRWDIARMSNARSRD